MTNVKARVAMARGSGSCGTCLWDDKCLHLNQRLAYVCRKYVCAASSRTDSKPGWNIGKDTKRAINGANAVMVSVMSDRTNYKSGSVGDNERGHTFDLVTWMRGRRLQTTVARLGHILRTGSERKLKQAICIREVQMQKWGRCARGCVRAQLMEVAVHIGNR